MSLTPEELELRRLGIGSSESPGIAGLPSFTAPIDTFRLKTEPEFQKEKTFIMEMGDFLEGPNLIKLAEMEGVSIVRPGTWKHPTLPIVDTVDGVATYPNGRTAPVEAKLVLPWNAQEYGEEGTDEVPSYVYGQCQHHLWARRQRGFDEKECLVPVFVGLLEWRLYRVPWDPALADTIIGHGLAFWENHVLTRIPPPPDSSKAYTDYLAQKYPRPQEVVLPADTSAERAAKAYLTAKAASEEAERCMREAANLLRDMVRDAEGIAGKGWAASWKADKNGKRSFRLKEGAA